MSSRRLLLALLLTANVAVAQERLPAPTTGFDPDKVEVHERELFDGLRKITGTVSIPDTRASSLIQPAGPVWRDYRRSYLPWIAAVLVLGMIAALAVFYAVVGRFRLEGGRSGRTLLRFAAFERGMHWLTASAWCVLAISGLNTAVGRIVLLPLLGEDAFSRMSAWLKFSHNFVAFPFTAGIILMFLVWVRHNIPEKLDVEWFRQGGGLVGHRHPPARKFNGGQKVVFWIVVLGGGSAAATGFMLLFPFYLTGVGGMQVAQVAHGVIALLMIAAMLSHIYIGTVGMEGAIDAMATGRVDLEWAKAHHSLWVDEELAKAPAAARADAKPAGQGGRAMGMVLVGVVVMVCLAVGGSLALSTIQKPAAIAFTTAGARPDLNE